MQRNRIVVGAGVAIGAVIVAVVVAGLGVVEAVLGLIVFATVAAVVLLWPHREKKRKL